MAAERSFAKYRRPNLQDEYHYWEPDRERYDSFEIIRIVKAYVDGQEDTEFMLSRFRRNCLPWRLFADHFRNWGPDLRIEYPTPSFGNDQGKDEQVIDES